MMSWQTVLLVCAAWPFSMALQWWLITRSHRDRIASLKTRHAKEIRRMLSRLRHHQPVDRQRSVTGDPTASVRCVEAPPAASGSSTPDTDPSAQNYLDDPYVTQVLELAESQPLLAGNDTQGFPMDLFAPPAAQTFETHGRGAAASVKQPPQLDVWAYERMT